MTDCQHNTAAGTAPSTEDGAAVVGTVVPPAAPKTIVEGEGAARGSLVSAECAGSVQEHILGVAVGPYQATCCPVCLEPYTQDNPALILPCNHTLHMQCAVAWRQRSAACPVCLKPTLEHEKSKLMTPEDCVVPSDMPFSSGDCAERTRGMKLCEYDAEEGREQDSLLSRRDDETPPPPPRAAAVATTADVDSGAVEGLSRTSLRRPHAVVDLVMRMVRWCH